MAALPEIHTPEEPAPLARQGSIRGILSYPPSKQELQDFQDLPLHELPRPFKRKDEDRVFCNRSLSMTEIQHIGFDMDYTLAMYKDPQIYEMVYDFAIRRLVAQGYPEALLEIKYSGHLGMRGLFFDRKNGNLVKVDAFGNIIRAMHGTRLLDNEAIDEYYPSKFIPPSDMPNYFLLDTLFHIPETCLLATVVDLLDKDIRSTPLPSRTGVQVSQHVLSYAAMQADVRASIEYIHHEGLFKRAVAADLDMYVQRDPRLPLLLHRIRASGRKTFLATNSDFSYTNTIMTYLFDLPVESAEKSWRDFFDVVVVSACKPAFFEDGTMLREVDVASGRLILGQFTGQTALGRVLAGGSSKIVNALLGSTGNDVLYVGDSIFGDVLKSKKLRGWSTLLVIPELRDELDAFHSSAPTVVHLKNLEFILSETYKSLDSQATVAPDTRELCKHIEQTLVRIEAHHKSMMGGLFRCKNRETFFSMQLRRYADLYSGMATNLVNYPLFYEFRAFDPGLPHEETGSHSMTSMQHPLRAQSPLPSPLHAHAHHGHAHSRSQLGHATSPLPGHQPDKS